MNQDTFYQFVHGNYSSKPKSYILAIENKDLLLLLKNHHGMILKSK